jgi:hypothetical protein
VYVAFDFNNMHFDERDFASSRLRVSQKLWGTRRREGAKEGDSSMNVEEVSSIVVDTAFHPPRERRSSLRHYLDDRALEGRKQPIHLLPLSPQ